MRKPPGRKVSWPRHLGSYRFRVELWGHCVPVPSGGYRNWALCSGTSRLVPEPERGYRYPASGTGTQTQETPSLARFGLWSEGKCDIAPSQPPLTPFLSIKRPLLLSSQPNQEKDKKERKERMRDRES